jgi:hypothetical protein
VGAPRRFGSVEKLYCVFAMQIGRCAVALLFPLLQLVAHLLVGDRFVGAVDLLADRIDLIEQAACRRS